MPRKNCQVCKEKRIEFRVYFDHGGPVAPEGSCYANLKTLTSAQICLACAVLAVQDNRVYNLRKILRADLKTKRPSLPKSERTSADICAGCQCRRPLIGTSRLCAECNEPGSERGTTLVSQLTADENSDDDLGF